MRYIIAPLHHSMLLSVISIVELMETLGKISTAFLED